MITGEERTIALNEFPTPKQLWERYLLEKVITKFIKVIANVYKQYKDRNFNVVISSSYEKLNKLSNSVF